MITNPIGLLADQRKMNSMTAHGKQNYIFELSKKFKEMKERYYKERQLTMTNKK